MKNRLPFFIACLLLCSLSPAAGMEMPVPLGKIALHQTKKATTYAGENFSPAVSPDGTRLAFVSTRQGNADIYVKALNEVGARAIPLTHYTGVDKSPAWSPDGKKMAFVSHREDPDGDLFLLDLSQPEADRQPKRLTLIETADNSPAWSPDGKALYYSSRLKGEERDNLWRMDVGSGEKKQITRDGGALPSVSPDGKYLAFVTLRKNPNGKISVLRLSDGKILPWTQGKEADSFPAWDPDGKKIYFSRCAEDTNLDGELSFLDNPSLWSGDFSEEIFSINKESAHTQNFRPLTSGETYDIFPSAHGETLYFASSRGAPGPEGRAMDILSIPRYGLFPPVLNKDAAEKIIPDLEKLSPRTRLMVLRDLLHDLSPFPEASFPASLHYKIGKLLEGLNHPGQAMEVYQTLLHAYPEARSHAGLARIASVVLSASMETETAPNKKKELITQAIGQLESLAHDFQDLPAVAGSALLRAGDFHLALKDHGKAMKVYDRVAREFKEERAIAAEAWFSKSKIYLDLGNSAKLEEAFLAVPREFPDVPHWTRRAVEEILRLATARGPTAKKTERLYRLADQYAALPLLSASALNRAGELYYRDHENLLAKQAHLRVVEKFPHEKEENAKAKFSLAKIYFEEEDFDKTFALYRELEVDPASAFRSRREFTEKILAKGERELRTGETRLAVKTYKGILDYDYLLIEAHRGLVQSHAVLNEIEKTVAHYQGEIKRLEKGSPPALSAAHYALGLALTYRKPPPLEESTQHVQKALALNGGEPFYYQTLGWLHEQKSQETGDNAYLEKAADAYQTAIALNTDLERTKDLPDLWLNLGNAQYLIQNFGGAYAQYKKRWESKTPFGTGTEGRTRESLYYQRFGEVSFKLGKSSEAVEYFLKSASLLEGPEQEKNQGRRAELHARSALVYQDTGEYEKAVDLFTQALEIYQKTGDRPNVALTLRNIANNLYFSTQRGKGDGASREALQGALNRYFETIRLMEKGDIPPPREKKKKGGALIQIDIEQGLDEGASRAASGFSKTDEEKLIFNFIGKIYGDFREYPKAVEYFKKKLALSPADLPPEGNLPILLERAVIENQIGNYCYLAGDPVQAADYFQRSLEGSLRIKNSFGVAVNALNLGRLVSELFLTDREPKGIATAKILQQLERAGEFLAKEPDYQGNGTLVRLKNLSGILALSLAEGWGGKAAPTVAKDPPSAMKASLTEIDQEYAHLRQAQKFFQEGLDGLNQIAPGKAAFSIAAAQAVLRHNLKTAQGKQGEQKISDFRSQISDSKSPIPNPKSKIQNPKFQSFAPVAAYLSLRRLGPVGRSRNRNPEPRLGGIGGHPLWAPRPGRHREENGGRTFWATGLGSHEIRQGRRGPARGRAGTGMGVAKRT